MSRLVLQATFGPSFVIRDRVIGGNSELKFAFDKDGKPISAESVDDDGVVTRFVQEREWIPTPEELASFTGDWFSEEAGATITFAVDSGKAFIKQRPATSLPLQPLYKDHFIRDTFSGSHGTRIERLTVCTSVPPACGTCHL